MDCGMNRDVFLGIGMLVLAFVLGFLVNGWLA
jgi:hypothetical protein